MRVGKRGWALGPREGAGRSLGRTPSHNLSTSRKEFYGCPDIHERAGSGCILRSHRNYTALPLPHPTHVSTEVKIHRKLSTALGSLSVDGWTCVPVLLFVRHEVKVGRVGRLALTYVPYCV